MNIARKLFGCSIVFFLLITSAFAQKYAVTTGDWDGLIWSDTQSGTPGSTSTPTSADDIVINSGVVVTISSATASCDSISFQDNTGSFVLGSGAVLNVYGSMTIDSTGTAFSSWTPGAKLRFTGAKQQYIRGFRVVSNVLDNTVLMEVVVDKSADTLKTPGTDMKLGLGTSLEIVHGVFMLGYRDDINGRIVGSSTTPTITVDTGAVFDMIGSLSAIRSGTAGKNPTGKMTVQGVVHVATTSSIGMSIGGVDIYAGGEVHMESFTNSYKNIIFDTVHVFKGGQFWNSSTTSFWNDSVATNNIVILDSGAIYKVTTSTSVFPTTFYNTGTVRYQRTAGDSSQTIADRNYFNLQISYGGNKTWALGNDRYVFDSLITDNKANFSLTAPNPATLNIGGTLRLTSGTLNNSNSNITVAIADDGNISRATGVITNAPSFESGVNLRYTSTVTSVPTGPEVPTSSSVLQDVTILCDTTTVTLTTPMTINGTLTLSNGYINNNSQTLTFADGATIRRATGVIMSPPTWAGGINLYYISTLGTVTTGNELPVPANVLKYLSIQSPKHVTLSANVTVVDSISLTRGFLFLDGFNLTLGPNTKVTGNPTDTSMVVITGAGNMFKQFTSAPSSFQYPIGDTLGGVGYYSPATLNFLTGTFGSGAQAGVRVFNSKHPQNLASSNYLNRYWSVVTSGITGYTCSPIFQYRNSDVSGNEAKMVMTQWDGAVWNWLTSPDTAANQLVGSGLTSLTDFTGAPPAGTYHFTEGWNLISAPFANPNMQKTFLYPSASSAAFKYKNGYADADTIVPGLGYWLKFASAVDNPMRGFPAITETIAVNAGWNIVGSVSNPILKTTVLGVGTSVTSNYFGYNGGYQTVDTLNPGKGYWVKVTTTGQLILGSGAVGANAKINDGTSFDKKDFITLKFTDAKGRTQTLFAGTASDGKINLANFEMPPAPRFEDGTSGFDVRYASNRYLENVSSNGGDEFPVVISATDYPVTITVSNAGVLGTVSAAIKVGNTRRPIVRDNKIVIHDATQPVAIVVSSNNKEVPNVYSLQQNYPNPFNPSTTIRFGLPEDSRVMLEVYSILGQKVQTLVEDSRSAGYYSVQWNASSLASGVYFYKLSANGISGKQFTHVEKMELVK